jgi:hypothetical protein
MAKSSIRSIRKRQSADAGAKRDAAKQYAGRVPAFMAGFEYVCTDVESGTDPEISFDLATTPSERRPQAFMDGAAAARDVLSGAAVSEETSSRGKKSLRETTHGGVRRR